MVMLDKKSAQKRADAFMDKLKKSGKTWEQFLIEQDAELESRLIETNKVANKRPTEKD